MALQAPIPRAVADRCAPPTEPELVAEFAVTSKGVHPAFKLGSGGSGQELDRRNPQGVARRSFKELGPDVQACLLAPLDNAVRTALARRGRCSLDARQQRAREGLRSSTTCCRSPATCVRDRPRRARDTCTMAFPVVLVDEFQDTDPVQWDLIRLITSDPDVDPTTALPLAGRLIVVGDPKQAIYSFRGADIDTYLAARELFTDRLAPLGDVHDLDDELPQRRAAHRRVNGIFSAGMDDASRTRSTTRDLEGPPPPGRTPKPGPAVTIVRDPLPGPETDPDAPIRSTDLEPRLLAQEIARAVTRRWQITTRAGLDEREYSRAAQFSDVAILYPARTGVPALLEALDDAGVPYRSGDTGLVFARPVRAGADRAITVIDDPAAQLDLWVALKSPLFGCGDDDLLRHRRQHGRWSHRRTRGPARRTRGRGDDARCAPFGAPTTCRSRSTIIDALLQPTRLLEVLAYSHRGAFDADCVRMVRAHAQQWQDEGGVGLADYLVRREGAADRQRRGRRSPSPTTATTTPCA